MSKLQETTMTTPEQLKEEFDKWYKDQLEMNPYIMRDYWLNKIQSLLGEIEGRIEGESKTLPVRSNEDRGTIDEIREINKVMGRNEALDKTLSIIQEYKGK